MDVRLTQIEKDMAVMSQSMVHISKTMDKMSDGYVESKQLVERVSSMDRELSDSFKHLRYELNEVKDARKWERSFLAGAVVSILLLVVEKVI